MDLETGLVYLSPVPFATFSQRPHALVEHFTKRGDVRSIWIDPYPTRLPRPRDLLRKRAIRGAMADKPGVSVIKVRALPVEPLPLVRMINACVFARAEAELRALLHNAKHKLLIIGKPSILALRLISHFDWDYRLYDAMDHFPFFYRGLSRRSMARIEGKLCHRADGVIAGSQSIADRLARYEPEVVLNGFSLDSIPSRRESDDSVPVIGYVGTIGTWFDWPLVIKIAQLFPRAKVRLIGPIFSKPLSTLPPNVELTGPMEHGAAMTCAAKFNIGLIPFVRSELTDGVDPIKYYEYRALGLPVVTTRFGEMAKRLATPGVFVADVDPHAALSHAFSWKADTQATDIVEWGQRFDASRNIDIAMSCLRSQAGNSPALSR